MYRKTTASIILAMASSACIIATAGVVPMALAAPNANARVDASVDPIRDAIDADIEAARDLRAAGEPGHARLLRKAAAELAAIGSSADAIQILAEVIDHQESIVDHREALRQQGQYYRQLGNLTAALRCFENHAALFEWGTFSGSATGFASGQLSRAEILSSMGAHQQSIDVLDDVLDASSARPLPEPLLASVYKWRSRNNERLGRHAEAAADLDDLLMRLPDYGVDNGRIIPLYLLRLRLEDPQRRSDEYWNGLKRVWEDQRLWRHPEILRVGDALLQSANLRGDPVEHTLFADEIASFIVLRRAEWLDAAADPAERGRLAEALDAAREQALISIQSSAFNANRLDLLIYALEELLKLEDDPELRQGLQDQIDGYRERL